MSKCHEHMLLAAYHDNELVAADGARVEKHLAQCAACTRELERIRSASMALRRFRSEQLNGAEIAALHEALERATDDGRVIRLSAAISVVAASIVLVGFAWLRVLPTTAAPMRPTLAVSSPLQHWERMAVTLRDEPRALPTERPEFDQYAAADLADWMLRGLP
jgi:anti-sigma factor RsiW